MLEFHSTRTHKLSADIEHWRGLLGTWAVVGAAALREVESRAVDSGRWPDRPLATFSATVEYDDGHEKFATLAAFKSAAARIDPKSVRDVDVNVATDISATKPYSIRLYGWRSTGVHIVAEAQDEAWVRGIVDLYREKLAIGEVAEYAEQRRAMTAVEGVAVAVLLLATAGVVAVAVLVDLSFLGVGVSAVGLLWLLMSWPMPYDLFDRKVRNPRLAFIGPAEPLHAAGPDGPVWKLQRWLEKHPVTRKLLEWAMAGAIGAAIAGLF